MPPTLTSPLTSPLNPLRSSPLSTSLAIIRSRLASSPLCSGRPGSPPSYKARFPEPKSPEPWAGPASNAACFRSTRPAPEDAKCVVPPLDLPEGFFPSRFEVTGQRRRGEDLRGCVQRLMATSLVPYLREGRVDRGPPPWGRPPCVLGSAEDGRQHAGAFSGV